MNADIVLRQTYSQEKSHYQKKGDKYMQHTCIYLPLYIFLRICSAERVILSQQEEYPPSRSRPVLHK